MSASDILRGHLLPLHPHGGEAAPTVGGMSLTRLTVEQARRVAVRAQLLDAERPTDLLPMVEQLTFLQLDPTAAVAPAPIWSPGAGWARPTTGRPQALERDRTLFEHLAQDDPVNAAVAMLRPMADLGCTSPQMRRRRLRARRGEWLEANAASGATCWRGCATPGRCSPRDIPDTGGCRGSRPVGPHSRNVTMMLEFLRRPRDGRHRRSGGAATHLGPGRAGLPGGHRAGAADEARARATSGGCVALGHRPGAAASATPASRPRSRAARAVAGRPGRARPSRFAGPHGAAVAVRPADPRPGARRRSCSTSSTCWRCTSRRRSAVGLLRPAGAAPRPAGRQARRHGGPQGRRAAGRRRAPGRQMDQDDDGHDVDAERSTPSPAGSGSFFPPPPFFGAR